mmetsp:Transcript_67/g.124  ORF Transcript_67/g.124 Transcript_67/m.124 type:complete len:111 (-) Transcript_67:1782-2114(-)
MSFAPNEVRLQAANGEHVRLFLQGELPAESVNEFLVLSAKESPLQKLVAVDQASRIGRIHLAFDDTLQDLEDLAAHFARLGHSELEEEHADVAIHVCLLVQCLAWAERVS